MGATLPQDPDCQTITSQTMRFGEVITGIIASILDALFGNDANPLTISLVPALLGRESREGTECSRA
jgi:hypothetical protein